MIDQFHSFRLDHVSEKHFEHYHNLVNHYKDLLYYFDHLDFYHDFLGLPALEVEVEQNSGFVFFLLPLQIYYYCLLIH